MNTGLKTYLANINTPWGAMIYQIVWAQIGDLSKLRILDFGSGFGLTANHFAQFNEVTAIEPNSEMVDNRISYNTYTQLIGSFNILKSLESNSFDYIICHNVLEYVTETASILQEFERVLKPNGTISILKHNHTGRIMHKVVFENNIDEALELLDGGIAQAQNFGTIHYYDINYALANTKDLRIISTRGVRTFWGLQQKNEIKYEEDWSDKMFQIEMRISDDEIFKAISFYHHVIIKKQIN